ncbi:MAG TPA: hypothetical protein VL860_05955 [Planctomycetota bacterium]|nr:hypothetical protein [Planctomycetota bacterium]
MITLPIRKRDILWNEKNQREALVAHAEEFFRNQQYSDALDFFERAVHQEGLERIKKLAIESGQGFLLNRLTRYNPESVTKADWEALKVRALALGFEAYAMMAERKINPELEQAAEVGLTGIEEARKDAV